MKKAEKLKRITALMGVILLAVMVIATLIVAIMNNPALEDVFHTLLICDFVVPVLLWMYLYLYNRAKKTDEMLSQDIGEEKTAAEEEK